MSAVEDFQALCCQYGLKEGVGPYYALLDIANEVDRGEYLPLEGMLEDRTILETAQLLKQLKKAIRKEEGAFSVVSVNDKADFNTIAPELASHLEGRLSAMIDKHKQSFRNGVECGPMMILKKGFGSGGYTSRGILVTYPEGVRYQEEGFSEDELGLIVRQEEELASRLKAMQGRSRKNKEGVYSWSAFLGKWALWIVDELEAVPVSWSASQKLCFAGQCLLCLGFLDIKGRDYPEDWQVMSDGDKQREVRDWIISYHCVEERESGFEGI